MTRKISFFIVCILLLTINLSAVDFDLVKKGLWLPLSDEKSTVEPTRENSDQLYVTEDGSKILKVYWNISPDKRNGGDSWTWGLLHGNLHQDRKPFDLRKKQVEIVYSSNVEIAVLIEQKTPQIKARGTEYRIKIPATDGKYSTIVISLKKAKQPFYTEDRVKLNLKQMTALGFQPVLPAGGECEFRLKSCRFIGVPEKKIK